MNSELYSWSMNYLLYAPTSPKSPHSSLYVSLSFCLYIYICTYTYIQSLFSSLQQSKLKIGVLIQLYRRGDVINDGEASIFPAESTKYKVIMDGTTGLLLSDPFSHHENVDVLKLSTLPGNEIVAMYIRYPMANLHCFIPMETRRISGKYISYSLSWLSTSKSISWGNLLIKDQFLC